MFGNSAVDVGWRSASVVGFRRLVVVLVGSLVAGLVLVSGASAQSTAHIYWANAGNGTIGEANLDGTGVNQSFITGANSPQGVAVDGRYIYWANGGAGTIGRANLDGTDVNQSFITGASSPQGVAVDGQYIYWANDSTIGRANLDGTGVNQNLNGPVYPIGVAVQGQHIYWANFANGGIGEANLDGTDVNPLLVNTPNPMFVTIANQRLYYSDDDNYPYSGTSIGVANLDGSGKNDSLITGANNPLGVAADSQHVYWANNGNGTIGVANIDGTGVIQGFITGADDPTGVAVSVPGPADTLPDGGTLEPGQELASPSDRYQLIMQGDGNLVLYGPKQALWSSHTAGDDGASVTMQGDGNLVIYQNGVPKWSTNTAGFPGAELTLGDNGRLVVATPNLTLWRWQSGYTADKLFRGETLTAGQELVSANRSNRLLMQADGNLVLYGPRSAIWASRTAGDSGAFVTMQRDGNLVVYQAGVAKWASGTAGHPGAFAEVARGHLIIYRARHRLKAFPRIRHHRRRH